jgi:hypothetical protein
MPLCDCCVRPYLGKSSRAMRLHKQKMRNAGADVPKAKPGPKKIEKVQPKEKKIFKTSKECWTKKADAMATEYYGCPVDDAQYDPKTATDDEEVEAATLFTLHELSLAIDTHLEDDYLLFGKEHIVITDPTNHMRGISIGSIWVQILKLAAHMSQWEFLLA